MLKLHLNSESSRFSQRQQVTRLKLHLSNFTSLSEIF